MNFKTSFLILFLFLAVHTYAQDHFSYFPEMPEAGKTITITYTPASELSQLNVPVEVQAFTLRDKGEFIPETEVRKEGTKLIVQVNTVPEDNLVFLKFYAGDSIDTQNGAGYLIPLYEGEKVKQGAYLSAARFYEYFSVDAGLQPNDEKTLESMEKEFTLYPGSKDKHIIDYLVTYNKVYPKKAPEAIQKAIEAAFKAGLKDEDDYSKVQRLYAMNKLTNQSKFIDELKKVKYPEGKWTIIQQIRGFLSEKDLDKKKEMWNDIEEKIKTDPDWKMYANNAAFFKTSILNSYVKNENWKALEKAIEELGLHGPELASFYNNLAWDLQEKNKNLDFAKKISRKAVNTAQQQMNAPLSTKPAGTTATQWKASNKNSYAMYADTYAMILYKLGEYKDGLAYAQIAAIDLMAGTNTDENNTYALLAQRVLSPKKIVSQLEEFVKEGNANSNIKEILRTAYDKKHSAKKTEAYMATLEKISYENMVEEIKKTMMNKPSPAFVLKDLDGNSVSSKDLKGKTVVLDFWATWCGPCKASFPGMQKMVAKYEDDPSVKFLFVDTWENGKNKEKNADDFITKNKYDFHVLMDNENKVVEKFEIRGIPTKFVIDRNGIIRFKSVGFGGSTDGLVKELDAMIKISKEAT